MSYARSLSSTEIDLVNGGAASDAWGAIAAGLALISGGAAIEVGTAGVGTPAAAAVVGTGVALIHVGLIGLASRG